jgi:hypothetical protein
VPKIGAFNAIHRFVEMEDYAETITAERGNASSMATIRRKAQAAVLEEGNLS